MHFYRACLSLAFACIAAGTETGQNESIWSKGLDWLGKSTEKGIQWAQGHKKEVAAAAAAVAGTIYGGVRLAQSKRGEPWERESLAQPLRLPSAPQPPANGHHHYPSDPGAPVPARRYDPSSNPMLYRGVPTRALMADQPTPTGRDEGDRVAKLPGLNRPLSSAHYSGYLPVSAAHRLFYYFVEAQHDPAANPLVFWFNGGPGCSSLYGMFAEIGPFLVNPNGRTLRPNPNAWDRHASVVYIEVPYGVGFSYSTDANEAEWSDDLTAVDSYEAIKQFLAKFPAFRSHRVYLAGESYAGVYLPVLAERILGGMNNYSLNVEGISIGNGCMNSTLDMVTQEQFGYNHGFLDEKLWKKFTAQCNVNDLENCDRATIEAFWNKNAADPWQQLNQYDIYERCEIVDNSSGVHRNQKQTPGARFDHLLHRKLMMDAVGVAPAATSSPEASSSQSTATTAVVCENAYYDPALAIYLNLPEVQRALHIPREWQSANRRWVDCSDTIFNKYNCQYTNAYTGLTKPTKEGGMERVVRRVLEAGIRVLMYAGDTDMVCNFLESQKFADSLGFDSPHGNTAWRGPDDRNAGSKTEYAGGLTFTTIRGAGHMVPQNKPSQIYMAIDAFLNNRSFGGNGDGR